MRYAIRPRLDQNTGRVGVLTDVDVEIPLPAEAGKSPQIDQGSPLKAQ
jgi:hypothetical protein